METLQQFQDLFDLFETLSVDEQRNKVNSAHSVVLNKIAAVVDEQVQYELLRILNSVIKNPDMGYCAQYDLILWVEGLLKVQS